jgi:hypothetical protein
VFLQIIMVAIVIFVPQTVTFFLDKPHGVDPSKVTIELQAPPSEDSPPPVFK